MRCTTIRCRSGLSLIELLVVVSCLAVMVLIVIPTADSRHIATLRAAARQLVADLEYAKLLSIGNGEDPCMVVFDVEDSRYTLARLSDPNAPINDPGMNRPYITQFGEGRAEQLANVTIDDLAVGGDDRLAFNAWGVPDQGTDATVALRFGESTIQVRVEATTGDIRVE